MIHWIQYVVAWASVKILGLLPRPVARALAASGVRLLLISMRKLTRTAEFNLRLALPNYTEFERRAVMKGMARNLGWMVAEFARFPLYNEHNIGDVVVLDGHEHFLEGQSRGQGLLYLTGHIGAWELSSYAQALYGFPLHYLARPLPNRRLDAFVNRYRSLSGNAAIIKNESARAILRVLKQRGAVGILADQNTMPAEGVFVNFFGLRACMTTGIARVALRTGATVLPAYTVWDENLRKYRLRFERPVELVRTGDSQRDIIVNTQRFATVIENTIRRYPDQWVWIHARWKSRPIGDPPLYDFL